MTDAQVTFVHAGRAAGLILILLTEVRQTDLRGELATRAGAAKTGVSAVDRARLFFHDTTRPRAILQPRWRWMVW